MKRPRRIRHEFNRAPHRRSRHGAFAESSSWDGVIDRLLDAGHPAIAAANPLRGLASDAEAIGDVVRTVEGPVVLVGHSYGGAVISNVAADAGEITGLVYVAGFAPDPGQTAVSLSQMFPGSTLGDALRPVPRSDGTTDLYIATERYHERFCADLPAQTAARMAATQRPVTQEALAEPSGEPPLAPSARRGSCSARRTASFPPTCSTTWPSTPARAARCRSQVPRTPSVSHMPLRPRT